MKSNSLKFSFLLIGTLLVISCSSQQVETKKTSSDRVPATESLTKDIKYGNSNLIFFAGYYSQAGDGIIMRDIRITHKGQKHFLVGTFGYQEIYENTASICNSLGYKFARQVHYLAEDLQDMPPGLVLKGGKVKQVRFSPKLAYVNTIHCGNDLIEMDRGS